MPQSPLLAYAHDGKKFYEAVLKRLEPLRKYGKSLNMLCTISGVDFSTVWRWNQGSRPELDTINRLEKVFRRWERETIHNLQHVVQRDQAAGAPVCV